MEEAEEMNQKMTMIQEGTRLEELETLKNQIERMERGDHIDILKMLIQKHRDKVKLHENAYGTLINLSEVPKEVREELSQWVNYRKTVEKTLKAQEADQEKCRKELIEQMGEMVK